MNSFSVIVTACNNAATLPAALHSVEAALAFLQLIPLVASKYQVVVVDDGSLDDTPRLLGELTHGKSFYTIVRQPRSTSPSAARNAGVAAAQGDLLFFLDGDDLFLPSHLHDCLLILADPRQGFVKTGVVLDDPVHPEWLVRIEHSVVINLCVRRTCHFAIGGFLDYHLFMRDGDDFRHEVDLFFKYEDQFYNELLTSSFKGVGLHKKTVHHLRYPGNSFDRQYEKFRQPVGVVVERLTAAEQYRLRLCQVIFKHRRAELALGHHPASVPGNAEPAGESREV